MLKTLAVLPWSFWVTMLLLLAAGDWAVGKDPRGQNRFIMPARDAAALAEAVLRFVRNSGLAREMAPKCREAVKAFSIDAYGKQLAAIIQKSMACWKNSNA